MMNDLSYLKIPDEVNEISGLDTLDAIYDCLYFYRDYVEKFPNDTDGIKYLTQSVNAIINSSPVATKDFENDNYNA
jgi:hypothetical protein